MTWYIHIYPDINLGVQPTSNWHGDLRCWASAAALWPVPRHRARVGRAAADRPRMRSTAWPQQYTSSWGWFIPRTFPVKCGDGSWLNHEIQVCGWSYINSRLPLSGHYHILIQNHWFIPLSTHQAVTRLSKTCSSFVRAQRRKREGRWLKVIMRGNPLIFVCNNIVHNIYIYTYVYMYMLYKMYQIYLVFSFLWLWWPWSKFWSIA